MKKSLLLVLASIMMLGARADEGMWIPMLIGKNYDEMQRMGLKLTKDDLYSINHSSMKDAILQFAGGCTAEMISNNGLLLTNHHCGYDAIASLSTVDRNLLDNGFWAHNMQEELPAQGVTALFLQRMEDVTTEVKTYVGSASGEAYSKRFDEIKKVIEEREGQKGKFVANVKEYFNGNQYFLLIYKKYTDVRLVGTPPKSLGKFGGDTDNWVWPRHTSDFSMFRIYAGADNEPAAYSASNVPYHPGKFLPVSIKGVEEGDYAMIFGYPGRTNRYEVSYGVDLAVNTTNPAVVACRDLRLAIMKRHMDKDKSVYLQLTSRYSSIANYWKYYIGQTEQLKRLNVVDEKKKSEDEFTTWARTNGDPELMSKFANAYAEYKPYAKHAVYYSECFRASALTRMAGALKPLYDYYEKNATPNDDSVKKYITQAQTARRMLVKEFEAGTDKEIFAEMTKLYYDNVDKSQLPDIYSTIIFNKECVGKKSCAKPKDKETLPCFMGTTYSAYADYVFSHTIGADSNVFNAFCAKPSFIKLKNDAAVLYAMSFMTNYTKNYQPKVEAFSYKKAELAREYVREMMLQKKDKMFYPDANSTMRITYGKVKGYNPKDGVHYKFYTTLDGLMEKYKPGSEEFDVPQDLVKLYKAKDFGRYADAIDGKIHTGFITTDDITGGNSGSPCINANGELIGAAFDGNWEAMSGDIAFDKTYKRTIVCDIRFILFLIDKMGHADNLIKEMDIRQ